MAWLWRPLSLSLFSLSCVVVKRGCLWVAGVGLHGRGRAGGGERVVWAVALGGESWHFMLRTEKLNFTYKLFGLCGLHPLLPF